MKNDHWRNVAAQRDSLHRDAEGRYHRAAVEVENFRDLRRVYGDSLSDLRTELRRIRARETAYVHTIAQLQRDTTDAIITAIDTVWQSLDDIQPVAFDFRLPFQHATVDGRVSYPPPAVTGSIRYAPISLGIVLSQLQDKSYRADIQGPPELDIRVLDATVVNRPKSWLQRNHPWIASIGLLVIWERIRP